MFFKEKIDWNSVKKIAVVRRNGLGDLLCAFPLILFLKKKVPHAQITLFVDQRNAPLVPFLPFIDQVVVFPKRGNKYWNAVRTALKFFATFDVAISAKTSPMKLMDCFLFALNAKKRMAYVENSKWHSKLINVSTLYDKQAAQFKHQSLKNLQLVDASIHEVAEELYPSLTIPHSVALAHKGLSQELSDFRKNAPLFLIAATTTKLENRLEEKRYADYLNRLNQVEPITVIIVGQSEDELRAKKISSSLSVPHIIRIHNSFAELMVIINSVTHVFVGDGGIAHMAAAFGKKGVVLYGGISPVEWAPLTKQMTIFFNDKNVNVIDENEVYSALRNSLSN